MKGSGAVQFRVSGFWALAPEAHRSALEWPVAIRLFCSFEVAPD